MGWYPRHNDTLSFSVRLYHYIFYSSDICTPFYSGLYPCYYIRPALYIYILDRFVNVIVLALQCFVILDNFP